jgi:hypothetical protein
VAQTLEEEKQTDLKLTEVTEQHIMAEAPGGADEEAPPAAGPKGDSTKRRSS